MAEKKRTAPYIPFPTFTTALDNVAEHNVPNVIDRTVFPTFSGASVSGALSSFKFFGLIDDDGVPNDQMAKLALEKEKRKQNVKELIEKNYASLTQLDLSKVTPTQFDKEFSEELYNVSGNTKTKAKSFFLKAAQFADIPISRLLLQKSRASSPRKRRAKNLANAQRHEEPSQESANNTNDQKENGTTKRIELANGGKLTLSASIDLLSLKGKDRDFVFKLIDLLDSYESEADKIQHDSE